MHILANGDEAYPEMLAAIDGARQTIGLSSYIMQADTIGGRFVDALQAAKNRGVEVRVIVDGVGSGWLLSPVYHRLRAVGVPVGRFMHSYMPWRMAFLNLRTHKKILIVDGRLGFTGGINVADQNLIATRPKDPVQDTHFRIEGPIVSQLVFAFARDWAFVGGRGSGVATRGTRRWMPRGIPWRGSSRRDRMKTWRRSSSRCCRPSPAHATAS